MLFSVVTRFLYTVESTKSSFTLKLLAETNCGATHRHSLPDKEGNNFFFVDLTAGKLFYDASAKTSEGFTKMPSPSCISFSRETSTWVLTLSSRIFIYYCILIMTSNIATVNFPSELQPETKDFKHLQRRSIKEKWFFNCFVLLRYNETAVLRWRASKNSELKKAS